MLPSVIRSADSAALGYSPITNALLQVSESSTTPAVEPITPLPEPPAADPLKVALVERLCEDPRFSPGGSLG
jgi:cytochrome c peroxidase